MKVKYILHNMNPMKRDMMEGDLKSYVAQKRYKMAEGLKQLKSNRAGVLTLILKKVRKHSKMIDITVESLINSLEYSGGKASGLFGFTVENGEGKDVVLIMDVDDVYFMVDGMVKALTPRIHRKSHDMTDLSKEKWEKWFEHELSRYHLSTNWTKKILEP